MTGANVPHGGRFREQILLASRFDSTDKATILTPNAILFVAHTRWSDYRAVAFSLSVAASICYKGSR